MLRPWSSRVIEIGINRKHITPISYYISLLLYASVLSFPRYNDLLVENLRFCAVLPTPVLCEALVRGFPLDLGLKKTWYQAGRASLRGQGIDSPALSVHVGSGTGHTTRQRLHYMRSIVCGCIETSAYVFSCRFKDWA